MAPDVQQRFQAAADAAIDFSTEKHLAREKELVEFFKGKGLTIYEPDREAFRKYAQEKYLASDLATDWPEDMVDKINALSSCLRGTPAVFAGALRPGCCDSRQKSVAQQIRSEERRCRKTCV